LNSVNSFIGAVAIFLGDSTKIRAALPGVKPLRGSFFFAQISPTPTHFNSSYLGRRINSRNVSRVTSICLSLDLIFLKPAAGYADSQYRHVVALRNASYTRG